MSLKNVDFTSGIRSEPINYNFQYINNQINSNMLMTIGKGIFNGFDISLHKDDYSHAPVISIDSGTIIDSDGSSVFIDGYSATVDIVSDCLTVYTGNIEIFTDIQSGYKFATLSHIPYSKNCRHTALVDYINNSNSNNIDVVNSNGDKIDYFMKNPDENILYFIDQPSLSSSDNKLIVSYFVANKSIIYTIYINNDNKISICSSLLSTSPSTYIPDDMKYMLGTLTVDTTITNKKKYTSFVLSINYDDKVNMYTDSNGELYLCGQPFSSIAIVHTSKPVSPKPNDLWYNTDFGSNELLAYRKIDGIYRWCPVTKYDYSIFKTSKTWNPANTIEYTADYMHPSYFIFSTKEQDMYYKYGTNSLSVIVDNTILHKDQFTEITLSDIYDFDNSQFIGDDKFKNYYSNLGYNDDFINSLLDDINSHGNNINSKSDICIGFKIAKDFIYNFSSDKDYERGPFVEAIVTHSFNSPSSQLKIQKSSSYVYENNIVCSLSSDYIDDNIMFNTNENYILGQNQLEVYLNGRRLAKNIEFFEVSVNSSDTSNKFSINKNIIRDSDIITYRINKTIFSYSNDFCNNIPKGKCNFVLKREGDSLVVPIAYEYNVCKNDYLNMFTSERIALIDGADYEIQYDDNGIAISMKLINETIVPFDGIIYVYGLKFSNYGESGKAV